MSVELGKVFSQSYQLISEESDRGAVIIAASILDERLERLIKSKLITPIKKSEDRLFSGGNAPLGTFSAKIELAYRLELINESYCNLLNAFRKIRNECAHNIENFSIKNLSSRDRLFAIYKTIPDIHAAIASQLNEIKDAEKFPRIEFDFVFSAISAGIAGLEYGEFNGNKPQVVELTE